MLAGGRQMLTLLVRRGGLAPPFLCICRLVIASDLQRGKKRRRKNYTGGEPKRPEGWRAELLAVCHGLGGSVCVAYSDNDHIGMMARFTATVVFRFDVPGRDCRG